MTKKSLEKLADYLEGLGSISYDGISPIGAVLVSAKNHKETVSEFGKNGFVEVGGKDLMRKLSGIENGIALKEKIFINLNAELPAKALKFFLDIAHGNARSAKILFMMPAKLYDNYAYFDRFISSVCRL